MPILAGFVPILLVLERTGISLQGFALVVEVNEMIEICLHSHTDLPHERLQWDLFHLSKLHFICKRCSQDLILISHFIFCVVLLRNKLTAVVLISKRSLIVFR